MGGWKGAGGPGGATNSRFFFHLPTLVSYCFQSHGFFSSRCVGVLVVFVSKFFSMHRFGVRWKSCETPMAVSGPLGFHKMSRELPICGFCIDL